MRRAQQEEQDAVGRDATVGPARCVWMTAGVVSYRLCNRAFDCDHCPLDRALREGACGLGTRERLKGLNGRLPNFTG